MSTDTLKKRYHLLDELRGFAVLCMVFYHAFYLMAFSFESQIGLTLLNFFTPLEPIFAAFFIFLSGVCSFLTRSNFSRGIKLLLVAVGVTIATAYLFPLLSLTGFEIYFGVLHLLATGMLLVALFKPMILKIPSYIGFAVSIILFFLTYNTQNGYLGFGNLAIELPEVLYEKNLFVLGFFGSDFWSADYFPLLPWLFMFFAGAFIGKLENVGKFPNFLEKRLMPFFTFFGKRALIIYILHQPVIYGVFYVLGKVL